MIETERLILRPPSLEDFEPSYALSCDPDVMRFITSKTKTREEAWSSLLRNIGHWTALGYGLFTISEKATRAFVGETGLARFNRGLGNEFDPFPEAAWVLTRGSHGRGYAIEAARAAHDWLAMHQAPARTVCIVHPDNIASLRVAEKLGYRPFGRAEYRGATPIMFARENETARY